MTVIRWREHCKPGMVYPSVYMKFFWLLHNGRTNDLHQIGSLHGCREEFIKEIIVLLGDTDVDLKKYSLGILLDFGVDSQEVASFYRTWVKESMRILNMVELHANCRNYSKALFYPVKSRSSVWILHQNQMWMHCPQLLSLCTLILKLGRFHTITSSMKTLRTEDIERVKNLFRKADESTVQEDKDTVTHFTLTASAWARITKNYKVLFPSAPSTNFRKSHYKDGISRMVVDTKLLR